MSEECDDGGCMTWAVDTWGLQGVCKDGRVDGHAPGSRSVVDCDVAEVQAVVAVRSDVGLDGTFGGLGAELGSCEREEISAVRAMMSGLELRTVRETGMGRGVGE